MLILGQTGKYELFDLKGRDKGKELLTPSSPSLQKLNNSEPVPKLQPEVNSKVSEKFTTTSKFHLTS